MGEVKRRDEIQGEIIHEYDGIEEADNALPNWWLLTFYGAIIFSIGYWFYYEEYQMGPSTPEQYAMDVAERAASGEADEQTLVTLATDTGTVAEGQETFATTCAACHGAQGEGNIGPNLTDAAWLHGGSPMAIYTSIKEGISSDAALLEGSAGMPEWGPVIGERRTQAVTAYLLSIRDTNVEGGREAEGDPYDPDAAPTTETEHVEESEGASLPRDDDDSTDA